MPPTPGSSPAPSAPPSDAHRRPLPHVREGSILVRHVRSAAVRTVQHWAAPGGIGRVVSVAVMTQTLQTPPFAETQPAASAVGPEPLASVDTSNPYPEVEAEVAGGGHLTLYLRLKQISARLLGRWRRNRRDEAEAEASEWVGWLREVRDTEVADFAVRTVRPVEVAYEVHKRPTGAHRGRGVATGSSSTRAQPRTKWMGGHA